MDDILVVPPRRPRPRLLGGRFGRDIMAVMRHVLRSRRWAPVRLVRLEDRMAPAALTSLASRAEPTLFSDAGGGSSENHRGDFGTIPPPFVRAASTDGRFVTYISSAGNVVTGQVDANGTGDVFVY